MSNKRDYQSMTNRDFNSQIKHDSFPHTTEKGRIKATISNLAHLFEVYGITCQYDEILKKQTIKLSNESTIDNDLTENSGFAKIRSLMALNDMPITTADLIPALLEQNMINPILDYVKSKKWDKVDRLQAVCNTLAVDNKEDEHYRDLIVKTWLIQVIAGADSARSTPIKYALPKYELVLILQGGQGSLKSSWFKSLMPKQLSQYVIDNAHLDPSDNDTVRICTSGLICELGELGSTFGRSDIDRLKAFLSKTHDIFRLPYDRMPSNFKRRTSFGASVNEMEFLKDVTGARRFLPLSISGCTPLDRIDHQQLWAQVWSLYAGGEQWWCTPELEQLLIKHHDKHTESTAITEMITDIFNMSEPVKVPKFRFTHYSVTQIIIECGINNPTREQLRQARAFIEANGFVQVQSTNKVRGYWVTKESDNFETTLDSIPFPSPTPDNFLDDDTVKPKRKARVLRQEMFFVVNEQDIVKKICMTQQEAMENAINFTNQLGNGHCRVEKSSKPYMVFDRFKG